MDLHTHISEEDVIAGNFKGSSYVFYRLPDANEYTFISQQERPQEMAALDISDGFKGFVIAPFSISEDSPLLLISPDYSCQKSIPTQDFHLRPYVVKKEEEEEKRRAYASSFEKCHRALIEGKVGKVVLSRRKHIHNEQTEDWNLVKLFYEACQKYPHSFVTLWWTERSGAWLVATPETLIKRDALDWQTMALAGTMKWTEYEQAEEGKAWTQKNKDEQEYVASYIEKRLQPLVNHLERSATYTSKAVNLAHLRTDFHFVLKEGIHLCEIIKHLHPTPAVCGVPKDTAYQVIQDYEDSPRKYYAGFSGPINWDNKSQLYVSLRCMEITPRQALLYAGGGLLIDSRETDEWTETQRKMQTMLHLFEN